MKKVAKIVVGIFLVIVVLIGGGIAYMFMNTNNSVKALENETIDMEQVSDGTYVGESEAALVYVKVEVEVKDHKMSQVKLLEHRNGKGQGAEVIVGDMVKKNTDQVDAVSGATASSKTIMNAVNKALQKGIQ